MSRRRPVGRPPRKPGHDYTIEDIPMAEFRSFKKFCEGINMSMRDALITLMRHARPLIRK